MKIITTMKLFAIILLCIAPALAGPTQNAMKIKPLKDVGSRIVGGNKAQLGQFPYQVAIIGVKASPVPDVHLCSGSLISPEWVFTAAHCVDGTKIFQVRLGTVYLDNAEYIKDTEEYIVHEDWDPNTMENDVGLIHLTEAVPLSDNIATIKLAEPEDYLGGGVDVTVSGWGVTSDNSTGESMDLNYVALNTLTNEQCKEFFPNTVGDGMVCTDGSDHKSTCNGDSGGPLVTGSGSSATHVGIVSWVSKEGCESGYPAGFSRTATYSAWVAKNTGI